MPEISRTFKLNDYHAARQVYVEDIEPGLGLDHPVEIDGDTIYPYDGPETVMLSTGYAEVFSDGDVVQHGQVIFNVAE